MKEYKNGNPSISKVLEDLNEALGVRFSRAIYLCVYDVQLCLFYIYIDLYLSKIGLLIPMHPMCYEKGNTLAQSIKIG